jgi:hypothetical protein
LLSNCTNNGNTIQAVGSGVSGLTPGDLVLFNFGSTPIVAEVTAATSSGTAGATGSGGTVTFASGDPLNMNGASSSSTCNCLAYYVGNTTGYATRVLVISYYIDNSVSPPRLMRQVSGHTPTPLVDNVVFLQFTYDLFNDATMTAAVGCHNPGITGDTCISGSSTSPTALLPTQITKINIAHMSMSSMFSGSRVLSSTQGGYQGLDLETSVSARNLTYANNYQCTSNCTTN